MKQRVIQISFDVIESEKLNTLSNIVRVIEDAGIDVLGAEITASWSLENYKKGLSADE